ncbi:MAG: DUF1761 domain-containing protein [Mariniphaga sp.]|nr:DUF1761 domain-containing protein [Mariniphaga sp.]
MEFGVILGSINYLAVLVAALCSFIVGWLWYGPLFGKAWMRLHGFTEETMKEGDWLPMPVLMLTNYIATVLAAFALAMFLGADSTLHFGIFAGFMIAVFWIATNRLNDVLYEKKPLGLFFINVGYNLVVYILMGAIIGVWH